MNENKIGHSVEDLVENMSEDTIAAIASGMTASGIGIIRISGPEAFAVLRRIFRPKTPSDPMLYKPNTIHYGHIVEYKNPENVKNVEVICSNPLNDLCEDTVGSVPLMNSCEDVIDECLVMVMRGPHTFTTEDTVEINSHGGPYVMQRILDIVLRNGARAAMPGEFTKRAFLGGRIDLTEAEAVMDVIGAKSDDALKSSLMQLSGSIRNAIVSVREIIMNELAYIEAALDDPEHYDLTDYPETLLELIGPVEERLSRLSSTFGAGKMVREGILTVIIGKPNAGKSSLLNALTGEDRAIVTDIEGTTRDVLEEEVRLGGVCLRMIDTAGIREAKDKIEQIGIERARSFADRADLILAIFDSARPLDENDREILSLINGKKSIILLNKSDIEISDNEGHLSEEMLVSELPQGTDRPAVIRISAKEQTGLKLLEETIQNTFFSGGLRFNEETIITNARHYEALRSACSSLELVRNSIEDGMPEDFYSIDLMDAYRSLGEIIGEEVDDDLVETIFAKFCMGK